MKELIIRQFNYSGFNGIDEDSYLEFTNLTRYKGDDGYLRTDPSTEFGFDYDSIEEFEETFNGDFTDFFIHIRN